MVTTRRLAATSVRPVETRPTNAAGRVLQEWRKARGLSQLALALEAEMSARHVSFVETGRTRASREVLLRLAEVLDVPLRDRNRLLVAGGYAPAFPERPLSAPELSQLRQVLGHVLVQQEPWPTVVVDRAWNVVMRNESATRFVARLLDPFPAALAGKPNALRLALHPDGLRRVTVNWTDVAAALLRQLHRAVHSPASDGTLEALYGEVTSYPDLPSAFATAGVDADPIVVPLHVRTEGFEARLLSVMSTFARAHEVSVQELRIETLVPDDAESMAALRSLR